MPNYERMSLDDRPKHLKPVAPRCTMAKRRGRSELLTEMAVVTGLRRNSLIRLMGMPGLNRAPKRPRFRRRKYGTVIGDVVRVIWESLDYVCAERLTPVLLDTGRQLAEWEELVLTPEVESTLSTISRSTVQRLLKRFRQDTPKLPRRKPQPPNRLLRGVPTERLPWDTKVPGSLEADLVHHSGPPTPCMGHLSTARMPFKGSSGDSEPQHSRIAGLTAQPYLRQPAIDSSGRS